MTRRRLARAAVVAAAFLALAGIEPARAIVPPGTDPAVQTPIAEDVNSSGTAVVLTDAYNDPPPGAGFLLTPDDRWVDARAWVGLAAVETVQPLALNDAGLMVGRLRRAGQGWQGFAQPPGGGAPRHPILPFGHWWWGESYIADVNEAGLAAGYGNTHQLFTHYPKSVAFLWDTTTGVTRTLGLPWAYGNVMAYAINDAGVVAGSYLLPDQAYEYVAARWRPPHYAVETLPASGDVDLESVGIADDGTMVFGHERPDGTYRALRWRLDGTTQEVPITPRDVAGNGTIVGSTVVGGESVPAMVRPGSTTVEVLDGPPGTEAHAVDDTGTHILGHVPWSGRSDGDVFRIPLPD